jgi:O-antigen/teichoic acid export membrane protein
MKSGVARRVLAGMGANGMAQAITIFIQLASLPLFLRYWDVSRYGVWLMISAVPSYFLVADVGMVTAAGNKMTMAIGRGDVAAANTIFQSALVFMLLTCGAMVLIGVPGAILFAPPGLEEFDRRLALAALILGVLLGLFSGLAEAIFRATGRYALGTTLANVVRMGEWCGYMSGLILFRSFAAVAIGGLVMRIAGSTMMMIVSARRAQGLEWRFRQAQWIEIRSLARPAISFMAFPLSNALAFQGMTLLVGSVLGASAVALFNTYRTLARVAVQATSTFSLALWPEFSLNFGGGGVFAVISMYRRAATLGVVMAIVLSLLLWGAAPMLLKLWTHGAIAFLPIPMLLMLGYAAFGGSWHVPRVFLISINEHERLAVYSLLSAAGSLLLAAIMSAAWQLDGIIWAMLLSELAIAGVSAYLVEARLSVAGCQPTNHLA